MKKLDSEIKLQLETTSGLPRRTSDVAYIIKSQLPGVDLASHAISTFELRNGVTEQQDKFNLRPLAIAFITRRLLHDALSVN